MRAPAVLLCAALGLAAAPSAASGHALMSTANGVLRLTDGDAISRNAVTVTAAAALSARSAVAG
jgi:hypothetical protein